MTVGRGRRHHRRARRSTSRTASTTRPTRSPPSSPPACSAPQHAVVWAAFFNFIAFLVFGTKVADDDRQGRGRPATGRAHGGRGLRRSRRRHRLEPRHVLPGPAVELVARARRRHGRRARWPRPASTCSSPRACARSGCSSSSSPLIGLALGAHRHAASSCWLIHRSERRGPAQPGLPSGTARVGRGVQPRPRRQRRAEDDGDHPRAPDRGRAREPRRRRAAVGRAVGPHRHRLWAR